MKIALIRQRYSQDKGGVEKVAARFVEQFLDRGHEITVFSEAFHAAESETFKWVKVPRSAAGLGKTSSFHRQVQQVLKGGLRDEFDVIYAMSRTYPADVFRITEELKCETIPFAKSRFNSLMSLFKSSLKVEREALDPANTGYVIANSELIKDQIVSNFEFPENRISVVRNGINHKLFFPATATEKKEVRNKLQLGNDFLCLFAASDFRGKGLEEAIRVVATLDERVRKRLTLLVVGDGKSEPFLKIADACGVNDNIVFLGHQKNMRQYYIASDILLYPSHYETFGNVCLEACACGIPIITTRTTGASELIQDNRNGYLVKNSMQIDKMASFLSAYAELPKSEHRKFSKEALNATKDYTWEKHADAVEDIFRKVTEEKCKKNK
jgi:UDP-glucose:(heptosyl)LPS alpha-1,3-glucosyltransferase